MTDSITVGVKTIIYVSAEDVTGCYACTTKLSYERTEANTLQTDAVGVLGHDLGIRVSRFDPRYRNNFTRVQNFGSDDKTGRDTDRSDPNHGQRDTNAK